jgi:hypothetical protein
MCIKRLCDFKFEDYYAERSIFHNKMICYFLFKYSVIIDMLCLLWFYNRFSNTQRRDNALMSETHLSAKSQNQ